MSMHRSNLTYCLLIALTAAQFTKRSFEQCHKICIVFYALQNTKKKHLQVAANHFPLRWENSFTFFTIFLSSFFSSLVFIILPLLFVRPLLLFIFFHRFIQSSQDGMRARCCQRPQMPLVHLILLKRCRSTDERTRIVHCRWCCFSLSVLSFYRIRDGILDSE